MVLFLFLPLELLLGPDQDLKTCSAILHFQTSKSHNFSIINIHTILFFLKRARPDSVDRADWLRTGCECFLDVNYDVNDQLILPLLLGIIQSYSKAKADQPNFEPGHSIDYDGIAVNNSLVPPPHHELLHDGQAITPLQSQATSQAALPPTLPVPKGDFNAPSVLVMPVPRGVDKASKVDRS